MKPGFYAVIGNSDYIKINNRKIPIWELLEHQPTGWLCSLQTRPEVIPENTPIIWDCGAYSYREQDYPTIKGRYVDAYYVIHKYRLRSKAGDIIVSPDNLLMGDNINWRRQFNLENATNFIKAADSLPDRIPMATIHGLSLQEKLSNAYALYTMGYRHLGIGGLVRSASDYSGNLHIIRAIVEKLRSVDSSVHLHVFGLCAPKYASAFQEMNLSFDGSTHARTAFTEGIFLINSGKDVVRYPLSHAPRCLCRVCQMVKKYGINPHYCGKGRNHDSARMAHNLNQLLVTIDNISNHERIYLISGCGKQLYHPAPARELYCSQLFQASRDYVQNLNARWFILSPLHHTIHPNQLIQPYDKSPHSMSEHERCAWATTVTQQLVQIAADEDTEFVFLTGRLYREKVIFQTRSRGYKTRTIANNLGIGQKLAWLKAQILVNRQQMLNL
ncbi:DUF6884 domain-containing protein [Iningainema tapete]|uniref:DUF6884 domain-containing protein n=1 Tax=Iningainema tapete BLCC-T55 TaxID=2748662 RepID=A0A8J7BWL0_9CYAN|nr:DUF6884 domain-containing protein [Iningainema tapete]MBD2772007.1 hypothetical protein [Iningainema tapete BLCC-T55]